MYYAMIIGLMAVLPVVSIIAERLAGNTDLLFLVGRWFVFWGAGIRLLLAGIRQMTNPAFTAKTIFEIEAPDAGKIVRELGFANTAMGLLATASIIRPDWVLPAAIVTGLYYGLAGVTHIGSAGRNRTETWALVSDLGMFAILAIYAVLTLISGR